MCQVNCKILLSYLPFEPKKQCKGTPTWEAHKAAQSSHEKRPGPYCVQKILFYQRTLSFTLGSCEGKMKLQKEKALFLRAGRHLILRETHFVVLVTGWWPGRAEDPHRQSELDCSGRGAICCHFTLLSPLFSGCKDSLISKCVLKVVFW